MEGEKEERMDLPRLEVEKKGKEAKVEELSPLLKGARCRPRKLLLEKI